MAVPADEELVGILLVPFEARLRAVDLDPHVVLAAVADLRGGHGAERPILIADDGVAVVVERSRWLEDLEVRADLVRQQASHRPAKVIGMGADVAEAAGGTALGRIGSPGCLLLPLALQPRPQPALDVFRADRLDLTQFAGEHHLAGLPHERVAGVVVGDGEDDVRLLDDDRQILSFFERERERLVADTMEAGLDGGLGHRKVHVVGGGDRDEVDPLVGGQGPFTVEHLLIGAVGAGEVDVVIGGAGLGPLRVAREGACHERCPVVEHGGRHVDPADERALTTPHDSHPQLPAQRAVRGHSRIPFRACRLF